VKKHLFHLCIHVLTQKHQSNDLERRESRELVPLDIDVQEIGPLLLFLRVCADLLDRAVDQIFGVTVDRS